MRFAICIVSAAPLRKEASHRSEMISQLLFGETMEVLEEKEEWLKIKCTYDGYEGWLTYHLVTEVDEKIAISETSCVSTGLLNPLTLPKELVNLPLGSSLTGYDEETRLLWDGKHKYHGTFRNVKNRISADLLIQTIQHWNNAPYLWGGRTFLGVDCSGFVQVTFKVLGIKLLRDAYQQATQGTAVALKNANIGDVAFFNNEAGRITHVGIILDGNRIVHASGKVRIDVINNEGIFNKELQKQTHTLHSIKRVADIN
jgi:hypothetical protein